MTLCKAAFPLVQLRMQCDTCVGCMRKGNSMQEERHAQNACAKGRRKVTHVSRSQTGRYVRVFASFRLLVHVSVWSFDRLLAYWHASSCVVAQVETQPNMNSFATTKFPFSPASNFGFRFVTDGSWITVYERKRIYIFNKDLYQQ
jgi:hypothetical protein